MYAHLEEYLCWNLCVCIIKYSPCDTPWQGTIATWKKIWNKNIDWSVVGKMSGWPSGKVLM